MKQVYLMKSSASALLAVAWAIMGTASCGGDSGASTPAGVDPTDTGVTPPVTPGTGSSSQSGEDTPSNGNETSGTPEPAPTIPATKPPELVECTGPKVGSPLLRALTRNEFQSTVNDVFAGIEGKWSNNLPSNSISAAGFDNDAAAVFGEQATELLLSTAESVGDAVAASLSSLLPCTTDADRACASEFVETFGKRLFRRDLSEPEKEQYLALFDTALAKTDFPQAIKWVTAALVESPKAVYRSELGTVSGDGRTLSQHELATLLAYTFTGTTPSAELLAKADAGELTDLVSVAKSLLQTPEGKRSLHRFFEAYTGYPRAASKNKPAVQGSGVTYTEVSGDMVQETRAFLDDMLFTEGANFQELLTSTKTFPSQRLAGFYGMTAPGSDYAPTERGAGQGIGLMAQGSFLAAHANADASSPTQRGLFAYVNVMCRTKPPIPEDVPQLTAVEPGAKTTRERYEEIHAAESNCAGCHNLFDPLGFAFEHFDEGGRYRPDEDGLPIDPTGSFISSAGEQVNFASQEELATTLAGLPEVQQCLAAYLATFAFGTSEACLATQAVPEMQAGTMSIVDAFASLAGEPHFVSRKNQ